MLDILIFSVLCGLGSTTFVSFAETRRCNLVLAGGWLAGASLTLVNWVADPVWVGLATTGIAAWLLARPCRNVSMACGGCLAGLWSADLVVHGLPMLMALVPALLALVSARFSSMRSDFVSYALREEALAVVLVFGLAAAATPVIGAGWLTATELRGDVAGDLGSTMQWPFWSAFGAFVCGSVFSIWRYR